MLRRLHIRDYLLIEELDLPLDEGLTIITGETGSGKSILVGALGLAMGDRADSSAMRDPGKRCVIELEVDLSKLELKDWFAGNEIPFEPTVILRRQLDPGGRSRAFINDTPVRLETLRELGSRLVHVHSQHHSLLLNDPRFQLGLVDEWVGQRDKVEAFSACYSRWQEKERELNALKAEEDRARTELEFLLFQLTELQTAELEIGEQERIELELGRAENAEELAKALHQAEQGIQGERGVMELLARIRQGLSRSAGLDPQVAALFDRLGSVQIELKDIGSELDDLTGAVSVDPEEADRLRTRLDMLLRLQQKHRVASVEQLIAIRDDLGSRTGRMESLGDRITELDCEVKVMRANMMAEAEAISQERRKALEPLAVSVMDILNELGMPHALFRMDHRSIEAGPQGIDRIRAKFSANKDREAAALEKVASGGELSRVMLALISLMADHHDLPTVIFDEIDTGVSGEVADRVGTLMARMGERRQVIAITHLPQIASKASQHLLVSKGTVGNQVRTAIDPLDMERRVEAIAQMLSGRKLTKQALENARVLLKGK